jgi:AcrR family transcriptional regulator
MAKPVSKIVTGQKTAAHLVAIAKKFFRAQGYANTALEDVVREAGVTRGALYHHFDGKKGLFLAVFNDVQTDIVNRLIKVDKSSLSIWDRFISCTRVFFEACLDSELQQIILIDAPAVLGWATWRKIDEEKTFSILRSHLKELIDKEIIKPLPIEPLAHAISGANNEALLWVFKSDDPKKAFDEAWSTVNEILWSLRK